MSDEKKVSNDLVLKNVRIAFADGVFTAKQFEGKGDYRYSSSFIIEPGSENDKIIWDAIKKACAKTWEKKADVMLESLKHNTKDFCYYKGDLKDYDGYAGKMILRATRNQKKGAPLVLDRDMSKLEAGNASGRPYSGCFVNAKVQIWGQKDTYTGVRCTLVAVQFVKDGEAFGGGGPATADGFDEVVDEDMSDLAG